MARGMKTGGRKRGTPNRATIERNLRAKHGIQSAMESGVMPLDLMLRVMRGGEEAAAVTDRQFQAAVAAAPYIHARLAATAVTSGSDSKLSLEELVLSAITPRDGEE